MHDRTVPILCVHQGRTTVGKPAQPWGSIPWMGLMIHAARFSSAQYSPNFVRPSRTHYRGKPRTTLGFNSMDGVNDLLRKILIRAVVRGFMTRRKRIIWRGRGFFASFTDEIVDPPKAASEGDNGSAQ